MWPHLCGVTLDHTVLDALAQSIPAADLPGIYRAFATDLTRLSAELSALAAAGEAEAARRAAHALAGTAAGVGATALEALARRMMLPGAPPPGPAEAAAIAAETAAAVAELTALAGA
ncbi:MAG: Hpt domain-containing protein [Acetobacteraceae bacterium]